MAKRQPKTTTESSKPGQPSSDEQSGSTGRRTDVKDTGRSKDSGQDRYGQSGLGATHDRETEGQTKYRESGGVGKPKSKNDSNRGSGSADEEVDGVDQPTRPDTRKP